MKQRTGTMSLALGCTLAVVVGGWSATPAYAQADAQPGGHANGPVVLSAGHVDAFEVSRHNAELVLMLKDDTVPGQTVFRDPADVIMQAVPESAWELPGWLADLPEFAFLGAPGDVIYLLPDTDTPGMLWPGASTERLRLADFDGYIALAVTQVDGPGALKLYTVDGFGSLHELMVDSADAAVDDTWEMFVGSHAHFNWVFTAAGSYTVTVQARATLADGTPIDSAEVDYTFVVGELSDPGEPDGASQLIVTTVDDSDGALVISIDPGDREVILPRLALATDGASLEASGELRPVMVTDTRAGAPGWSASGQVGRFTTTTTSAESFAGGYLGWRPVVLGQAEGQNVQPGQPVPAGFPAGDGLTVSRTLAAAGAGDGRGTARLGADLELRVPTDTRPGTYRATLTFTVI